MLFRLLSSWKQFQANIMNPAQTAPLREQSDLGSYCLQYKLPKYMGRENMTVAANGYKGLLVINHNIVGIALLTVYY